ncbi:MAG: hypothetical protein K6F32_01615 [Bacilli bacterium]|nr:hypothetical protein [Bacilli bacterium]
MSEIKGQLLGMLMVLLVFSAVASAMWGTFTATKEKVVAKASDEIVFIDSLDK